MKEFLYWGDVQQRLSDYAAQAGTVYSFYDAARELWEEGRYHTAEELPIVSFEEWDTNDLDAFDQLYSRTPVDMSIFRPSFQLNQPGSKVSEPVITTDVVPLRLACDQALGLHHHDFFEIDYVMRGAAKLELDGITRHLKQGEFCFLSSGLAHDIVPLKNAQVISITVAPVTVDNTLYRLLRRESVLADFFRAALSGSKDGYLLLATSNENQVRSLLRAMLHDHFAREEYFGEIGPDYLAILFAVILRQCGNSYERNNSQSGKNVQSIIAVLKYIQDHFKTTSLNEVAEIFHYDPSYLGKQIKAATGKNYTDIIRDLRIDKTKTLLRTTDLSMDEVAEQAGFDSRVHFYRCFRAETGITPGEFRRETSTSEP